MPERAVTLPPEWLRMIDAILITHPDGMREIDLIDALAERAPGTLSRADLTHPMSRFRVHFMLFHALYQLRANLIADQVAQLTIAPLSIKREPWQSSGSHVIDTHDPLAAYYLDWRNLSQVDVGDVMAMIGGFWQTMAAPTDIQSALASLELSRSASWPEMKQQYRMQCMTHHPDRGGDTEAYQKIQAAYDVLKKRYGHRQ